MSTSSAAITADIIELNSANYFEWLLCVLTTYYGACKGSNLKGLYDIVCTDAEWLRENGGDATNFDQFEHSQQLLLIILVLPPLLLTTDSVQTMNFLLQQ